jgi:tripartite-type tricarboxylate transporter receptor subunit TctC
MERAAMKLARRNFLHLSAGAAVLPVLSRMASAQAYPTRPVRIIIGFPAGSTGDILARLEGQWLSERLGQTFVIENRPGAAGNIGAEAVVRAPPDGYTLLHMASVSAINATLYHKLVHDIAPVAGITRTPGVMVVHPLFPAKTVPELIAFAKVNPGKINFASTGNGTANHMYGELFKMMAAVDMVHVPYRSNPMPDLLGGQVQVMFSPIPASIEYIRAGTLRALAVTTATRSEALPHIPTIGEFVPGYEASAWSGIGAPKNTPAEIIDILNKTINASLTDPKVKARLADLGSTVLPLSPADFGKLIAEDTEKWAKVIRAANIKAD